MNDRNKKKRLLCDHCKEIVSKSIFHARHRGGNCINKRILPPASGIGNGVLQRDHATPRTTIHSSLVSREESSTMTDQADIFCNGEEIQPNISRTRDEEFLIQENTTLTTTNQPSNFLQESLSDKAVSEDEMVGSDVEDADDASHIDDITAEFSEDDMDVLVMDNCNLMEDFAVDVATECPSKSYNFLSQIFKYILLWQSAHFISDSAIEALLVVIKKIFHLVNSFCAGFFNEIIEAFPESLYKVRKIIGIDRDKFMKYVVCPKCDETYLYEEAIILNNGERISKSCSKVEYPQHNQVRFRQQCGAKLMKTVISQNGKKKFLYPFKVYSFQNIQKSIELMLQRKGFKDLLHGGPKGTSEFGFLSDINDGNIFKTFLDENGESYFKDKRNLGLMLNIDWFNPFKRTEYSMGVIYLVLLNLPRSHRFKWENVITLGIIPGPKEPSITINSFLKPHVDELLELWRGQIFMEGLHSEAVYRVALLATSSDVPATRKCGGFMAHNANKGCSKCLKSFSRDENNRPDYSGYDTNSWVPRTGERHKNVAELWKVAANKTIRESIEFEHGVRFSELFRLPYFDPVRMHLIDPMHNLMLGIAKHTFHTWIEIGKLTDLKLQAVESRMSKISVPSDTGRIARHISKCYKSMKADEWKHWTLVYSMFSLRGIIEKQDLNIWSLFVNACTLICRRAITLEDVDTAHQMLKMFCQLFCDRYGKEFCVPNMHLSLHIKDCIIDYGPVYGFWCFSFERYNGALGKYHTNNHSLTVQVMRKFVSGLQLSVQSDDDICDDGLYTSSLQLAILRNKPRISGKDLEFSCYKYISVARQFILSSDTLSMIVDMLQPFYDSPIKVSPIGKKFKRLEFQNQVLATYLYCGGNSPYSKILAKYPSESLDGGMKSMDTRPCQIRSIYEVLLIKGNGLKVPMVILECGWFKRTEHENMFGINSTNKLWSTEISHASFIPIVFVIGRCIICMEELMVTRIGNLKCTNTFNVVIPLSSKSIL